MCLYLAFPLSCLSTNGKVKRGLMLTYVVTWLSVCNVFLVIARYKKKMVSTYVCIRLSLYHVLIRLASCNGGGFNVCLCLSFRVSCPSTSGSVKRGWCLHMLVPGFPSVMSVFLSQGEKGVGLTSVYTWLCLYHVFLLIANR